MNKDKITKKALALPPDNNAQETKLILLRILERNMESIMKSYLFGKPPTK